MREFLVRPGAHWSVAHLSSSSYPTNTSSCAHADKMAVLKTRLHHLPAWPLVHNILNIKLFLVPLYSFFNPPPEHSFSGR